MSQVALLRPPSRAAMQILERFGVPLEDGGRRLRVNRTVGAKGSSASVNGCSVKVSRKKVTVSQETLSIHLQTLASQLVSSPRGPYGCCHQTGAGYLLSVSPLELNLFSKSRW